MQWRDLSFLADENMHPEIVQWLREEGLDVKYVREENLTGTTDKVLLNLSNVENRTLHREYIARKLGQYSSATKLRKTAIFKSKNVL